MSTEEYFVKLEDKHPGMFVLSGDYVGMDYKIELQCKQHGPVTKLASTFISGPGCGKCAYNQKMEKASQLLKLLEQASKEGLC